MWSAAMLAALTATLLLCPVAADAGTGAGRSPRAASSFVQQLQPLPGHGHDLRRPPHQPVAHAAAPAVLAAITRLRRSGAIASATAARCRGTYLEAQRTLSHLSGTRAEELSAVLTNAVQIADSGGLTPSRLPSVFLTIQRNREWWSNGSLLSYGDRVSFPGSRLVWEYYPGQGIELQWLATFGEANGYYLSGDQNEALRQVLDEASALAVNRAGGIAWEYLFHFDGGPPPWVSGLSQGTAIQAFARAAQRLHEPAFETAAQSALGIFEHPPPSGVRLQIAPATAQATARAHYLEYSFAPQERILNGFIQSLNGLYDFSKITGSVLGLHLFEEGDANARLEVPHYNTGSWSLYDQHSESDLGYHELLAEFLQDLCGRTRQGPPTPPIPAQSGTGGTTSQSSGNGQHAPPVPIPGDEIYCTTATDFYGDLHRPPAIALLSHTLPTSARAGVQFSLSKISTVSITITRNGKVVWTNGATVEGGKPRLLWTTPVHGGTFTVTATAVDLAGNKASTSGQVKVSPAHRPH